MAWDELVRWSARVRRLAHDFNNALVPAFAHTDLLRLRLGRDAKLSQLDSLPTQLELARNTAHRAATWTVRQGAATPPTWRAIHMHFMMTCRQANVTLTWRDESSASELCAWDTHDARHVLRALIHNACEALTTTAKPEVVVTFTALSDAVTITVEDNGSGCDDLAAVASGTTARHGNGHLGLGLPSAATVAQQSHVELRVAHAQSGGFLAMLQVPRRTPPEA